MKSLSKHNYTKKRYCMDNEIIAHATDSKISVQFNDTKIILHATDTKISENATDTRSQIGCDQMTAFVTKLMPILHSEFTL